MSMMASVVLKTHTNMNGLFGPIQLTRLKLNTRINTPVISMVLIWRLMNIFMPRWSQKMAARASKSSSALPCAMFMLDDLSRRAESAFIMKIFQFLVVAMLSVAVCQSQPSTVTFQQRLASIVDSSQPPADTNAPVNYVIKVLMKNSKGETSALQLTTVAGSFELDTLSTNTAKINGGDIPSTLKMSGTLTTINDQTGRLKLFLGRTVPYVTSTVNNGTSFGMASSYSQMSVGLESAFVVTFGKPLLIQADDNGQVTLLVTRGED